MKKRQEVYDLYWYFAYERQNIFLKKINGEQAPWTEVNWKEDEFTVIDCQNIFCELDKYCRQALPDLKSNRTKIKKHYTPKKDRIEYIYPPKWRINEE